MLLYKIVTLLRIKSVLHSKDTLGETLFRGSIGKKLISSHVFVVILSCLTVSIIWAIHEDLSGRYWGFETAVIDSAQQDSHFIAEDMSNAIKSYSRFSDRTITKIQAEDMVNQTAFGNRNICFCALEAPPTTPVENYSQLYVFNADGKLLEQSDDRVTFASSEPTIENIQIPGLKESWDIIHSAKGNGFSEFSHGMRIENYYLGHSLIFWGNNLDLKTRDPFGSVLYLTPIESWWENWKWQDLMIAGFLTLLVVLAGTLIAIYFSLSFKNRILNILAASRSIQSGSIDRISISSNMDEIDELASGFNLMSEQITSQMKELRDLSETNALLAEEAGAEAEIEERNRLARELHDSVKQEIFGLSLTAGTISSLLPGKIDRAKELISNLERQAREIHTEIDAAILALRPPAIQNQGVVNSLKELITNWDDQNDCSILFNFKDDPELRLTIQHTIYRVAQEALNNISKHSNAMNVEVSYGSDSDQIHLTIKDDGIGFSMDEDFNHRSFGLISMTERLENLGGKLIVKGKINSGTKVHASIPMR